MDEETLEIVIPAQELYDETINEFVYVKEQTLKLKHSLVSISKWEMKWGKPFLTKEEKNYEETIDYIRCMTLNQNIEPYVYKFISNNDMAKINKYIESPMTATTFSKDQNGKPNREIITAELIYYWMISLNIPFECQKWHLNRLFTLIKVCSIKNQPPKKMSNKAIMSRNTALNAARRKQLNTKG